MQLNPYLTFNGQCEAAFKFYERVLGGKIVAMIAHEGTAAAEHAIRSCMPASRWATRS
jgi:PhnB protein